MQGAAGFFVWLLGLCVGSFLNVVIYRLPRGLSVSEPRRSFCPGCEKPIEARDNIPILGWLLLGGRCRNCKREISVQYPLIEAITGAAFVLVYYLIVVGNCRAGVDVFRWPQDLPLLASWLVLTAAMIACSGMDVLEYMIDVRVTNFCTIFAVLACAVWPLPAAFSHDAAIPAAAAAVAGTIATAVMLLISRRSATVGHIDDAAENDETAAAIERANSSAKASGPKIAAIAGVVVCVAAAGALLLASTLDRAAAQSLASIVVPIVLASMFAAIVLAGGMKRASDDAIHKAIEEERPQARRTALRELAWLTPIILAAAAGYWFTAHWMIGGDFWRNATSLRVGPATPIGGASHALLGAMAGAAAGWSLRILFTLVFGREAFGIGDIHILAAAGAAGGWDIALIGLLLSIGLALAGWLLGLLLKSTMMIPFGPWLAIGFVAALWLNKPIAARAEAVAADIGVIWENLGVAALGLVLIIVAVAIITARLLRMWLESKLDKERGE